VELPCLPIVNALELEPGADRPIDRERPDAEHALQFVQQFERAFHRPIALVHEREDRDTTLPADLEEFPRLRLDALGGIDHHHHRIHRRQDAIGVFRKILVAGRVEQVDAVAVVVELEDGGTDRDPALPFQFHPVGRSGALVLAGGHRSCELHGPAIQQQLLRQRGLAGVRMRNDGERAPFLYFLRNIHKGANTSTE